MTIYLDFDGTVVDHEYPRIGKYNNGCFEIIKKLQNAGHKIILNTYRANCNNGTLERAIEFINESKSYFIDKSEDNTLNPLDGVERYKIHPTEWNWNKMLSENIMFIDDITPKIPLSCSDVYGECKVNWDELDKQFIEHNMYF